MKKIREALPLITLLTLSACASGPSAKAPEQMALVELRDQIAGPAVHVHSTSLLQNGAILFDEYNITGKKDRKTNGSFTLCKLSSSNTQALVAQALRLTTNLPSIVDPEAIVALDGPYRVIIVRDGGRELRSSLDDYDGNDSEDARRFQEAWRKLEQLVSCPGA